MELEALQTSKLALVKEIEGRYCLFPCERRRVSVVTFFYIARMQKESFINFLHVVYFASPK